MLENSYPIRTDLALESQERLQEDQADMRGIRVLEERRENGVIVSTVMIETENASAFQSALHESGYPVYRKKYCTSRTYAP